MTLLGNFVWTRKGEEHRGEGRNKVMKKFFMKTSRRNEGYDFLRLDGNASGNKPWACLDDCRSL